MEDEEEEEPLFAPLFVMCVMLKMLGWRSNSSCSILCIHTIVSYPFCPLKSSPQQLFPAVFLFMAAAETANIKTRNIKKLRQENLQAGSRNRQ